LLSKGRTLFRISSTILKWFITLAVVGGLFWAGYAIHERVRATEGKANDQPTATEKASDRTLKFAEASAQAHGLKYTPAEEAEWREQVTVYGRVVANPAATATLQAPVAGTLRSDGSWPAPGQRVRLGQVLGRVEIRVGRLEQLDLQSKLADALIKRKRAEEVRDRRQELVKRQAQASAGAVTQLQKEEAEVQLAEAQLQVDSARAAVTLLQKALDEIEHRSSPRNGQEAAASSWSLPLLAPTDGEVTEVSGQPDTAMEAGGLIFRVVDFRRCRVRMDLPQPILAAGPPAELKLLATTAPAPALKGATNQLEGAAAGPDAAARLLGPAPDVDQASQFGRYWYEVDFRRPASPSQQPSAALELRDGISWRPGLFVKSHVKAPQAAAQPAIAVPLAAVLFHQGRALVYVRLEPGKFQRREVRILGRQGHRYFLNPRDIVFGDDKVGVDAGELVVSDQAQILLSEEFRSQIDND
jgi:biotin carboxyl carrier protein